MSRSSPTIAFILTSHSVLGSTGNKTGTWLEELAVPYWIFEAAGFNCILASPQGGAAPLDPDSLKDAWISEEGRRFLNDPVTHGKLTSTLTLSDLDQGQLSGIFLVGGAGTTWDFPLNDHMKTLVETTYNENKVIAAICHGVIGLTDALLPHGEPLVKNRLITSISNAEDKIMGLDKIVPALPEDVLRRLRSLYMAAPPFSEHVICDAPFFTGQNPMSAAKLAREIVAHIQRAKAA